jgi:hypothetical protein
VWLRDGQETGRSDDCWWNAEKMVVQAKKAVDIFNKVFFSRGHRMFGQSNEPGGKLILALCCSISLSKHDLIII